MSSRDCDVKDDGLVVEGTDLDMDWFCTMGYDSLSFGGSVDRLDLARVEQGVYGEAEISLRPLIFEILGRSGVD